MNERAVRTYWLITVLATALGLSLWPPALFLAMAVTLTHSVQFLQNNPRLTAFPMQVRVGFFGLLILGQAPYFEPE